MYDRGANLFTLIAISDMYSESGFLVIVVLLSVQYS